MPSHTFATLSLQAGVNPKVVSDILGHSSVGFTLEVYTHTIQSVMEDATALVETLVHGEDNANGQATRAAGATESSATDG
jgi:Phage integrase family